MKGFRRGRRRSNLGGEYDGIEAKKRKNVRVHG